MVLGEFRRPLAALDRCTLKWPLKGGSRLMEVAATAGLTVIDLRSAVAQMSSVRLRVEGC